MPASIRSAALGEPILDRSIQDSENRLFFAVIRRKSSAPMRYAGRRLIAGHFTAHHEWRVPKGAWRAHRQIRNHSYTLRLAPHQELTLAVLEQAAEALQAHLT